MEGGHLVLEEVSSRRHEAPCLEFGPSRASMTNTCFFAEGEQPRVSRSITLGLDRTEDGRVCQQRRQS